MPKSVYRAVVAGSEEGVTISATRANHPDRPTADHSVWDEPAKTRKGRLDALPDALGALAGTPTHISTVTDLQGADNDPDRYTPAHTITA
jgi:hypothetical protein